MKKYTFFWNGVFSQWHQAKFTDGFRIYTCAEQFMMYQKAILFKDYDTAKSILKSEIPKEQKALGRKVKNFDAKLWDLHKYEIVKQGNIFKFKQNPALLKALLATVGTELVEASPYDKIWGIGLSEDDPRAKDKSTWQGENLLGKALDEVREIFVKLNETKIS